MAICRTAATYPCYSLDVNFLNDAGVDALTCYVSNAFPENLQKIYGDGHAAATEHRSPSDPQQWHELLNRLIATAHTLRPGPSWRCELQNLVERAVIMTDGRVLANPLAAAP